MRFRFLDDRTLALALFTIALIAFPRAAPAQGYTSQTIKLIVPYTPGTGIDILARVISQKLQDKWTNPVIVENRAGASSMLGTSYVGRAVPDGLTLLVTTNGLVINPHLFNNVPYDTFNDLTPVALLAWGRMLLVAHPAKKFNNMNDLVAAAKKEPGKITYASPGRATTHHVAMEMLKVIAGIDMLHVPYKGTAGAVTDILSGVVDTMFLPIHVALPYVQQKQLSVLGLGSARRAPSAPDIPTLAEQGFEGAEVDIWYALFAPNGTPSQIVSQLHREVSAIVEEPGIKAQLARQGLDVNTASSQHLVSLVRTDWERWRELAKKANLGEH